MVLQSDKYQVLVIFNILMGQFVVQPAGKKTFINDKYKKYHKNYHSIGISTNKHCFCGE